MKRNIRKQPYRKIATIERWYNKARGFGDLQGGKNSVLRA
jgi:hypothetical protein